MVKKKRSIVSMLFAGIILIAGIMVILYPYYKQQVYIQEAKEAIRRFEYSATPPNLDRSTLDKMREEMLEYNKRLFETKQAGLAGTEAYEQADFSVSEYGFEDGILGYLSIPAMGVELPVLIGATKENMNGGAVRLSQTSLPIGGENTNTVMAAHRGYATAAMFRDIEILSEGDSIFFTNFFETLEYKVVETRVIVPTDIDAVLIQEGRDLITLVTCHPFRFNYQRYLVYAERAA